MHGAPEVGDNDEVGEDDADASIAFQELLVPSTNAADFDDAPRIFGFCVSRIRNTSVIEEPYAGEQDAGRDGSK